MPALPHYSFVSFATFLACLMLCGMGAARLADHESLLMLLKTVNSASENRPRIGDCDGPPELIHPGRFIITLNHWYTILEHQERIGIYLQPHIRKIWTWNDNQYTYWAGDVDDTMLRAIFADSGVFEIACDAEPTPEAVDVEEDEDHAPLEQLSEKNELRR